MLSIAEGFAHNRVPTWQRRFRALPTCPHHKSLSPWQPTMPRALCLCFAFLRSLAPRTPAQERRIDFNRDVRPLLSNNCYFCHGPDEKERKGGDNGLRLDIEKDAHADLGGRRAIVAGDPDSSELFRRIASTDESEQMPPAGKGKKFSAAEVETIRLWIKQRREVRATLVL